jgi:gliding motility-associated-like protein
MKPNNLLLLALFISFNLLTFAGNESIRFTKNEGQWQHPFLYKAQLGNGAMFIEKNAFTYNFYNADVFHFHDHKRDENSAKLKYHAIKMQFVNANSNPTIANKNSFSDYTNYYYGKNPKNWHSNVLSYQQIHYNNLYNNIDLALYSLGNQLKYDVIVNPGGKVKDVQFFYEGVNNINIDNEGNLHIQTSINEIIEQKPYAYQEIDGVKIEVPCQFVLKNNTVTFKILKSYKKSHPLIIDPTLIFSSFSGSFANNFGMTATYGYDGSLFAGGTAYSTGYPTTIGAFDTVFNGVSGVGMTDVVISRYDSTGANLIYSTYIGGTQTETVNSIIANENNELYLFGVTSSLDFAKFNSTGTTLLGSTYIGGSDNDGMNHKAVLTGNPFTDYDSLMNNYSDQFRGEIMLDVDGNCYVNSSSMSGDFPTPNGFDNTLDGHQDAVIMRFNDDLTNLDWATYLGGTNADGYSIKVDTNKIVYVCGGTTSSDFPATPGTITPTFQGGQADGFLAKIDSNGSSILAATFIGTNVYDQTYFIEVDRFGSVYTVGQTQGAFPVFNALYSNPGSGQFIQRINNNLTTVDYSTLFGNGAVTTEFSPSAFLVDRCENVYVSGWGGNILGGSPMTGMPTTSLANGGFQPGSGDGFNFYLFVLERDAQSMLYGTYFGGAQSQEHVDGGTSRFDKNGIVYQSVCAGCQNNDDFPTTTGAWSQVNNSTGCNNGIFKFDFEIVPKAKFSVDNFEGCAPLTVTFSNSSGSSDSYLWDFGGGDTTSLIFNPVKTYNTPGVYNVTLIITDSICNTVDTAFQTITVAPPITISGGTTVTTCDTATLSVNTTGGATYIIWSSNNQFGDTLNPNLNDSSFFVNVTDTTWFYVKAGNGPCEAIDSFLVNYVGFSITAHDTATCLGNQTSINLTNHSNYPLTYSWTPTGSIVSGANTANPVVNPSNTTTYTVVATNSHGCTATDTAQVVASGFDPNNIQIWADEDSLYGGAGTQLHVLPNTGFTYTWTPGFNLDNPTIPNPFASPTAPSVTEYIVYLTESSSGCTYEKRITIYAFEVNCGEPDVFIPNAFTPNQDNENDLLFVRGRNVESMVLKIYDRWGELVFETDKQTVGWDGTYKGELVDPGVFVYYLNIDCVDGQEYFKKGNVTVIR